MSSKQQRRRQLQQGNPGSGDYGVRVSDVSLDGTVLSTKVGVDESLRGSTMSVNTLYHKHFTEDTNS